MKSFTAAKVIRRMKFVYMLLLLALGFVFLTFLFYVGESGVPFQKWLSEMHLVFSSMALVVAIGALVLAHGYSRKMLELSVVQLGVVNEQLVLMKRQIGLSAQQINLTKKQFDS